MPRPLPAVAHELRRPRAPRTRRLRPVMLLVAALATAAIAPFAACPPMVAAAAIPRPGTAESEWADAHRQLVAGQYRSCIEIAAKAIPQKKRIEGWTLLKAEAELAVGEYRTAAATIETGIEQVPASIRLRLLGHKAWQRIGETDRAQKLLHEIDGLALRAPWRYSSVNDLLCLGEAALIRGADPRFVMDGFYERARRQAPDRREPWLAIGRLALQGQQHELAAETFTEAARLFPHDADVRFGLALVVGRDDPQKGERVLDECLELNPHLVPALLFRADRLLDSEEYDAALALLERAVKVNPHEPDAWAFRAVLAHLTGDRDGEAEFRAAALAPWDKNPAVDHLIGLKLSQKYRFAEGAAYQRRALALDPQFPPARIQLCQDLLRLGKESEGWQLAEEIHRSNDRDPVTHNLLELRDRIAEFRTLENDDFIVRMSAEEADVYGQRVLALLGRAKDVLCEKYGLELNDKVTIEIFPEESDFAVRTFGMPGDSGFLGVCFGKVITATSPATQRDNPANWEAVLWHEFCHVVTLELTQNRMPRWLSEGISVYEERQADPTWGQSMTPQYRQMILDGQLTPVGRLSSAFAAPKSSDHVAFAYFESALVVEYLLEEHGREVLQTILNDLRAGLPINAALERRTDGLAALEQGFERFARRRAEQLAPGVDWQDPEPSILENKDVEALEQFVDRNPQSFGGLLAYAQSCIEEENWDAAKPTLQKLIRLYPQYIGNDNPYKLLAGVHRHLGETGDERRVLRQYAAIDAAALDCYMRLVELDTEAEDWLAVLKNAERAIAVNPMLPQPYHARAAAAEELGRCDEAISACRALLAMKPKDPADVHYRLARLLHDQRDPLARQHVLAALKEAPRFEAARQLLSELDKRESSPQTSDAKPTRRAARRQ